MKFAIANGTATATASDGFFKNATVNMLSSLGGNETQAFSGGDQQTITASTLVTGGILGGIITRMRITRGHAKSSEIPPALLGFIL